MQERIVVENFGGIKKAEIDLKKINIFIGPQASGKSVLAKLIYFFKDIPSQFNSAFLNESSQNVFKENVIESFQEYFPLETYNDKNFKIEYKVNSNYSVSRITNKVEFNSTLGGFLQKISPKKELADNILSLAFKKWEFILDNLSDEYPELRPKELIFIPAGRVLFASIQANIYSFLNSKINIDPFLLKFGQIYQQVRDFEKVPELEYRPSNLNNYQDVVQGNYEREKDKDYLMHEDGRRINIAYASSGQQESLPLVLVLNSLHIYNNNDTVVIIEEPEAHLFPSAQKKIVELVASTFNANPDRNIQFVITTHSPYILTSFNNLIQAGQISKTLPQESLGELYKVVPENQLLHIEDIAAYSVANGGVTNIIDTENNLIDAKIIDEVSNDIAIQFDSLLDLQ